MPGLEEYGRAQALEAILNGTATTYLALLEELPVDSAGEVEISPTGYARALYQTWETQQDSGTTYRRNLTKIDFGPYPEDVSIKGWAIYDAATGGNLIASGMFFTTGNDQAGTVFVPATEDIQFQPGQFALALSRDCPVAFPTGADICSLIDNISVSVGGGPPAAWNIGDPPIVAGSSVAVAVIITLTAASTGMADFTAAVTNASGISITDAPTSFLVQYTTGLAGTQEVVVENTVQNPDCTYDLGTVTSVS